MDIVPEIARRRAYRSISSEALDPAAVARMLEAATLAPSCYNNQPWRFIAVSSPEALAAVRPHLSEGNAWATEAPLLVLVCTKPSLDCRLEEGRDYALFDAGLATMNLILQAEREGMIAHPIAGFNPKKAKAACGVPADFVLITVVVCAKRGENKHLVEWQLEREKGERQRKPREAVVFADRWNGEA
ncbi:MAG: hypothetical protein A2Z99_19065 [Treponema sp. GWB1_62_6]|nr:MAG: hypothetical protein A2Y36_11015 [Treponema sp. GWA1_62_8]OHE65207.1 MAG: hypothetical protein A2Z99_19065 [Treponema sp. GWB1_62_6]OHE67679.1 MAG: hypothetical protein A2001_19370 [Treponema sp. GWC1_61_84]HCM28872.1 nitroreductase [Treponema sp.]